MGCSDTSANSREPCHDCVVYDIISTLNFGQAPVLPGPNGIVARNLQDGRYAFVDRALQEQVLIFSQSGELQHIVGRRGGGPGEFDRITAVVFDSSDSLWVVSRRGRRLDIFAPDLTWSRSQTLPFAVIHMTPMGGKVLASTVSQVTGRVGLMGGDGSFEPLWQQSVPRGSGFPSGVTGIVSDGRGAFWFSEEYAYAIWKGTLDRSIEPFANGVPEWFENTYHPSVIDEFGNVVNTRGATILHLDFDAENDLLWVVSGVPSGETSADDLRPLFDDPRSNAQEIVRLLTDHVVEAFDVPSGARVASQRFDDLPVAPFSQYQYRVPTPERVEIVRPVLRTH